MTLRENEHELPAYLFDLLEPAERAELEMRLAGSASLREALQSLRVMASSWSSDEAGHVAEAALSGLVAGTLPPHERELALDHVLSCRECAFFASVLLADRSEAVSGSGSRAAMVGRIRRVPWRNALLGVAALGVAAVVAFSVGLQRGRIGRGFEPGPRGLASESAEGPSPASASPVRLSIPLVLQVRRAQETAPSVPSHELEAAASLTLLVEVRALPPKTVWELQDGEGRSLAQGPVPSSGSPRRQRLALHTPVDALTGPGRYWLVLRTGEEEVSRWEFRVEG